MPTDLTNAGESISPRPSPSSSSRYLWTFGIVGILVAVLAVSRLLMSGNAYPVEGSAEAGFARDMGVHHAQAVEMALIHYERTRNETLKSIALDILLTQQNQIGQMQAWLHLWGLPIGSPNPPMAWMGMPTTGLMPGMATGEQMANLRAATGVEADQLFVDLMIEHHRGGIHMAEALVNLTSIDGVKRLAQSMINSQQAEIEALEQALTVNAIFDAIGEATAEATEATAP